MDTRSKYLRKLIVRLLEGGTRGHLGPAMSLIEIIRVLYDSFLNYNSKNPKWEDRDRLILSKGHGCLALYALLVDKQFEAKENLDSFCKLDSIFGGHPERRKTKGIEASTGALGHGLSIGVGMAIAAKIKKKKYRVVVVTGDGEVNEGSIWEAAMSASKHKLSNLYVLIDCNKLQSYGPTKVVLNTEPLADKWKSFGFLIKEVDGHNITDLENIINNFKKSENKPTAVICHTIKGKGITFAEGKPEWHHRNKFKPEEIKEMYNCLK